MYRYPEILNLRVTPGTTSALNSIAQAQGKRVSTVAREAVDEFVRRASTEETSKAA